MEEIRSANEGTIPNEDEIRQVLETKGPFSPQEKKNFLRKFDEGKLNTKEKLIGLYRFAAMDVPEEESTNPVSVGQEIIRGFRANKRSE